MDVPMVATVSLTIDAPRASVWAALVDGAAITRYMFVTEVESEWRVGAPIRWKGEFGDRLLDIAGLIRRIENGRTLGYSYVDPITGGERRVSIELSDEVPETRITVVQEGHARDVERAHAEGGWRLTLNNLKWLLERGASGR